jgi:hypothetical protein
VIKHRNISLLAISLLCFAGCSGVDYAMQTYGEVTPVSFLSRGTSWRIFDKPEDQIMMVTPSIGDVVGAGIVEGITVGAIGNQTAPVTHFRLAASEYLTSTGRTCTITSTREVVDPQWEFTYECRT